MEKPEMTGRGYAYLAVLLLQLLTLTQGCIAMGAGFFLVHLAKSSADDDRALIISKLLPYIEAHPQRYKLSDVVDMNLASGQVVSEMLAQAQAVLMRGGYLLSAWVVLCLISYRFFPDSRELRKTQLFPGRPLTWQSLHSLKFW